MRFERIELDRYGCFTDRVLDFGTVSDGADFHIIYGPNEAGKSTIRDACIDFLYGIKPRTVYNFIHDYNVMRIGAAIGTKDRRLEAHRFKGAKDTLRSPQGAVISESVLKAVLGDLSRKGFEQMFSLNGTSLEEGAEDILKSEGDLGALLFSAAAGLSQITGRLRDARARADGFSRKGAQRASSKLLQLKSDLEEIEAKRAESDVDEAHFLALTERMESARVQHENAAKARDADARRESEIAAILGAVKPWMELCELRRSLADLADAPAVPDGWDVEVESLKTRLASASATLMAQTKSVATMKETLRAVSLDKAALAIADDIRFIGKSGLEARYITARDIDKREQERGAVERQIADITSGLGQSAKDARTLAPEAGITGEITGLLDRHAVIAQAERSARDELEDAKRAAKLAKKAVDEPGEIVDLQPITSILRAFRDDLNPDALKNAQEQVESLQKHFDRAFSKLAPFSGGADDIKSVQRPQRADIETLLSKERELEAARMDLDVKRSELDDTAAKLAASIAALVEKAGIISDEQAGIARMARDQAWQALRDPMDAGSLPSPSDLRKQADHFHNAMIQDDRVTALRLVQTTERADLNRAWIEQSRTTAALNQLIEADKKFQNSEAVHRSKAVAVLTSLGLPPDFSLAGLEHWLESLASARERQDDLEAALKRREQKLAAHKNAELALQGAMARLDPTGQDQTGAAWIAQCEQLVEQQQEKNRQRTTAEAALTKALGQVAERDVRFEKARTAREDWDAAWARALGSLWIGVRPPDAVRAVMNALGELPAHLRNVDDLNARIEAMIEDRKAYGTEVARLACLADETFDQDAPHQTADRLKQRVEDAKGAAADHKTRTRELERAQEALQKAQTEVSLIEQRIREMSETIPSDDLEDLILEIRRGLKKQTIEEDVAALESDLVNRLETPDLETALATLNVEADNPEQREALAVELQAIQNAAADANDLVSRCFFEKESAKNELDAVGSDGLPAQLEERKQALLLEIEDEAHAFMRLSAGILVVEEALRVYRETHRSSMMVAASVAFVQMTRGAFSKLDTSTDGANEILVGVRADGSTIKANEMSRGTRFQLYLALRIAGHAEIANQREILPFFADDILEPFDDDRSRETFSLLHDMSKCGQVVYLTHHRHLCDLARDVCGSAVKVHELPDQAVAGRG